MLLRVIAHRVLVAAEDVDGIPADAQPRARNAAFVDRIAHRGVGRACTLGPHVALGCEARHQVVSRRQRGCDCPLRNGFLDRLQILGAGVKKKMNVRVNQAGEQRAISQVDDFCPGRPLDGSPHLGDALALNEQLARLDRAPSLYIEQPRSVQHDRVRGRR